MKPIFKGIHVTKPIDMSTADKIAAIVKDQYNNYTGKYMRNLIVPHAHLRDKLGDEKFLEYLEERKIADPRPVFEPAEVVVKEKDWEITSLRDSVDGETYPFTSMPDDRFSINAVLRLSDKQEFRIGDITNKGKIIVISVSDTLGLAVNCAGCIYTLEEIHKVPERKALFVTIDGIEVFEDSPEYLFYINDENWRVSKILACNFWMSESKFNYKIEAMEELRKGFTPRVKWFSTEDAATDYINMNKPVICVNDIHHILLLLSQVNDRDINKYQYNEQIKKSVFATAQSKINGGDK